MKLQYPFFIACLLLGLSACQSSSTDSPENEKKDEQALRFVFLSPEAAQEAIVRDSMEGFFEKVRPLELQLQMRLSDSTVTRQELLQDYRDSLRADVLPFSGAEQLRLKALLEEGQTACADFGVAWDMPRIELIKVRGQHYDAYTYYTRDNAIIIPQAALDRFEDEAILSTMLHEIFHIYSRYHPQKRKALYKLIGFEAIDTVVWSSFLDKRLLFNPDGLDLHYAMELKNEAGESFKAVPVIYSKSGEFREERNRFFAYVQFELFEIAKDSLGNWRIVSEDTGIPPQEAKGFQQQIGPNTQYIIHPDEILADNFVLLMLDKSVPASGEWLQEEMAKILQEGFDG